MTLKLTCPNESTAMFMSRIIQTGLTSTPKGFFDQYASIDPQEVNIEYNIEAQTIPDKITITFPEPEQEAPVAAEQWSIDKNTRAISSGIF